MFAGNLLRQLRQSAAPTVLFRSHRGQRVRFANVTSCSFVITSKHYTYVAIQTSRLV